MINESMLFVCMKEVCNFFIPHDDRERMYVGSVSISGGNISVEIPSPYIIIRGSQKNDGLYRMENPTHIAAQLFADGSAHPMDETFTGRIWFSYPTPDFLALVSQIGDFQSEMPQTDVASESFGSSSRSYAQGSNGRLTWREVYGNSLRPYRNRMFEEVW